MADFDLNSSATPNVGDDVIVPVHQGATRTTLFPDQVVTISNENVVELILLRQEFVVRAQRGVVLDTRDDAVHIEFTPQGVRPEQFDIGHIRLQPQPALDMALTILAQQIQAQSLDIDAVMQRLQSMVVGST